MLYCLPPHSSHITQPLDVGFYGPLKTAWRKAVAKYALDNVGISVTFAEVFKEAWISTVKLSTIVNSFRHAGIWPVSATVPKSKVSPATLYCTDSVPNEKIGGDISGKNDNSRLATQVLESTLPSATKKKFKTRYVEGYDVKDDELYNVWVKLKALTVDDEREVKDSADASKSQQNTIVESSLEVGEVFKQALVLPDRVTHKKTLGGSAKLPAHVSSDEAIAQMEDKIQQKKRKNARKKES